MRETVIRVTLAVCRGNEPDDKDMEYVLGLFGWREFERLMESMSHVFQDAREHNRIPGDTTFEVTEAQTEKEVLADFVDDDEEESSAMEVDVTEPKDQSNTSAASSSGESKLPLTTLSTTTQMASEIPVLPCEIVPEFEPCDRDDVVVSMVEETESEDDQAPISLPPVVLKTTVFALDASGKRCSHYQRTSPPLQSTPQSGWPSDCPAVCHRPARKVLEAWLGQRPIFAKMCSPLHELKALPWDIDQTETQQSRTLGDVARKQGAWFYMSLKNLFPEPKEKEHVAYLGRNAVPPGFFEALHASNMYSVQNIVKAGGVLPGKTAGRGGTIGVYCFQRYSYKRINKVFGYAVYSEIGNSGYFVAPFMDLVASSWGTGRGEQQVCCKHNEYYHLGIFFNVLTAAVLPKVAVQRNYDSFISEAELIDDTDF